MTEKIPSPPGLPLFGNVFDIDPVNQARSFVHLADIYGKEDFVNICSSLQILMVW